MGSSALPAVNGWPEAPPSAAGRPLKRPESQTPSLTPREELSVVVLNRAVQKNTGRRRCERPSGRFAFFPHPGSTRAFSSWTPSIASSDPALRPHLAMRRSCFVFVLGPFRPSRDGVSPGPMCPAVFPVVHASMPAACGGRFDRGYRRTRYPTLRYGAASAKPKDGSVTLDSVGYPGLTLSNHAGDGGGQPWTRLF